MICLCRVGEIKADLAQQIRSDFEEAFQGTGAKVNSIIDITMYSRKLTHESIQLGNWVYYDHDLFLTWTNLVLISAIPNSTKYLNNKWHLCECDM